MDLSAHNLPTAFTELSRLSDGNHIIYLRADPHSFYEVHRAGIRNLFSTTVAAFIPNVVIKLQTPLASSIIAAVPSRQGSATLHTRSNLFIVENLSDSVNLVQHHKAAFIREDATLAVWANEVQPALVALRQVLRELGVSMDRPDLVRIVEPGNIDTETIAASNTARDAFDEFIHDYEDPTDKSQDESGLRQPGRNTLLPMRTLDDTDDLEAMYAASRTNLFDSLSADSLALGDSPFLSCAVSSGMSRLCLNSAAHVPLSPTFSSLSFDFSSSSVSSDSSYDGSVLSTPLTVAPSVLSSPLSAWSSPQLPTLSESYAEDTRRDMLPVESVDPSTISPPVSDRELGADTPSKRKRSPKAKQVPSADAAVPEKTRPRRVPRAHTPPKAAPSPSPRSRKTVSKTITPVSPAPKRTVSPLPARSGRTRSSSISSTSSAASRTSAMSAPRATAPKATALKAMRSRAAQLTLPRVTHAACCGSDSEHEHELLESDDSGSEYEADPSELELDELDDDDEGDYDDYRPAKRTRSLSCSTRTASPATPVRRKAVSPKIASAKKKAAPKKRRSSFGCASSKKKKPAQPEGPPPTCIWCDRVFTRESDVVRHVKKSCKLSPFDKELEYCPLCDKEISRNDAVLRHLETGDCKARQRELREQGLLPPEVEEAKTRTKTAASARAAKKAATAALSPRRRSSRSLSV